MATNEYTNVAELIKDYYDAPVGSYLNKSININNVTLTCDVYRVANNTVLTSSVFTGCTGNDANTQIIIGNNMSVASGTTLTPPYRCKGIFIGDVGTFTNSGTISMTARGAKGAGKNIKLTNSYSISANGGSGGASVTAIKQNGNNGSSPSSGILSCGGGGSGSVSTNNPGGGSFSKTSGAGSAGTSFSGGSGGGGTGWHGYGTGNQEATSASSNGGAGGSGGAGYQSNVGGTGVASGGAGNPAGEDYLPRTGSSGLPSFINNSPNGTGGLIVILASKIVSSGNITAKGSQANSIQTASTSYDNVRYGVGGSSGGGCIVLLSREANITGTNSVAGGISGTSKGTTGGAGGAGVYASYIVDDLILANLPVEIAISDTNHLDNIEPSEGVRLLGMMDDDELYYEIMGTRHSSGSGHILEDEEGTALTKRKALAINSPLTVEDDSVNEKTDLGVDTDADLSSFPIPQGEAGTRGVPVGAVINFFGDSAPDGYLACDGAEYNKADYIALSAHLATLSTASQYVGSTSDKFKVPDLRGEFLRGTGTNGHTNQGNGASVGSHQDATVIPTVDKDLNSNWVNIKKGSVDNMDKTFSGSQTALHTGAGGQWSSSDIYAYSTRPTNTSVMYCIKY